jgi:hypothetical protein
MITEMAAPAMLLICLLLGDAQPPSPARALAQDLARTLAATVPALSVRIDGSLTEKERNEVEQALRATGLFIVGNSSSAWLVELHRPDWTSVEVSVARAGYSKRVEWPGAVAEVPSLAPTNDSGAADERRERVALYRSQELSLTARRKRWLSRDDLTHRSQGMESIYSNAPHLRGNTKQRGSADDWAVVRGSTDVLSDLEFAQLIGDAAMEDSALAQRTQMRWLWTLAFGGIGIAQTAGAWFWFEGEDREDGRAIAIPIALVGMAITLVGVSLPFIADVPRSSISVAEQRIERYNADLRRAEEAIRKTCETVRQAGESANLPSTCSR